MQGEDVMEVSVKEDRLREIIREELAAALDKPQVPRALSIKEAAEILGVNLNKMYEMTRIKGFPALRDGNRIIIPPDALKRWMDREAFANPGGMECVKRAR